MAKQEAGFTLYWNKDGVFRTVWEYPPPATVRTFYRYDWDRQNYRKASAQEVSRWRKVNDR